MKHLAFGYLHDIYTTYFSSQFLINGEYTNSKEALLNLDRMPIFTKQGVIVNRLECSHRISSMILPAGATGQSQSTEQLKRVVLPPF